VAQLLAQRDAPQSDHRVRLAVGGGDRKLRVLFSAGAMQARDEVARQKRTVRGSAEDPRYVGPVRRGPVEGCQNTREWPRKILHGVGNHRQAERREACGVAIGVENEPVALRLQPRDDAREDGAAADLAHRLVAAAHASRQPARQQHAGRCRRVF
jgi:hypothetical protein